MRTDTRRAGQEGVLRRKGMKKFEGTLKEENYEKRKGFFKKLKDMFNA